jgi:serine/threonine-protein phosphatase 5
VRLIIMILPLTHLFIGHNFPDAAKLYTQAIELDPTDKTFWCNRAIARIKLEEYGYALNDASQLVPVRDDTY